MVGIREMRARQCGVPQEGKPELAQTDRPLLKGPSHDC